MEKVPLYSEMALFIKEISLMIKPVPTMESIILTPYDMKEVSKITSSMVKESKEEILILTLVVSKMVKR